MNQLNRIQTGMMTSNAIPRLLPLSIREIDFQVTLQYDITGRRMFSHQLKSHKIGIMDMYTLLFELCETLLNGRIYMLDIRNFILDEQYMFVDATGELSSVFFCYVPLQEPDDTPVQVRFSRLVTRLMPHVKELSGSGIQTILNQCAAEPFDLRLLHEILLNLLNDDNPSRSSYAQNMSTAGVHGLHIASGQLPHKRNMDGWGPEKFQHSDGSRMSMKLEEIPDETGPTIPHNRKEARNSLFHPANQRYEPGNVPKHENKLEEAEGEDGLKESSARRTYVGLGGLLVSAVGWRFFYLAEATVMNLVISGAVTIVMAAVSLLAWNGRLFELGIKKAKEDETEEWRWNQADSEAVEEKAGTETEQPDWARVVQAVNASHDMECGSQSFSARENLSFNQMEGAGGGVGELSMLNPVGYLHFPGEAPAGDKGVATVLLKASSGAQKDPSAQHSARSFGYLERQTADSGQKERIELHRGSFLIGRAEGAVQYVESSVGASRTHVELSRRQDRYVIKDLASSNGTTLRGELMIPYKEYLLDHGDTFSFAGASYTFRSTA
ncbi:DUF6382 domain-containing protein [Paenibacillus sp. JX-17]|uniref:DUF6382 domain-containing protein n=1 Tax=Paenibacillus lacisoli TaxID=3064525 RepID=A0ABT9CI05_9BACL|nr:DUF6382 domain-containing protein [Paenibacillus sp. JX-17]MDO7907301.1 DUF6382 domain-containing protein [Paenibacillus sp. JX-17]